MCTFSNVCHFRIAIIVTFLGISLVSAYPSFKEKIPNGNNVPSPCKANHIWRAVGHQNPLGGGTQNQFGKDFRDAGKKWSKSLCQKDSDEDGRTNGEELGDPECTWTEGGVPKLVLGLTHPGVCDPFDDPACKAKNAWVSCDMDEFKCDAINEVSPTLKSNKIVLKTTVGLKCSTKNVTIRFPETEVPNTETNYYCMFFEFPKDDDYHIVAIKPNIDNEEVMHHILMIGCDETEREMTNIVFGKPFRCDMTVHPQCFDYIGGWTVGQSGHCSHRNAGFRIGTKGYRKGILQFHWNNPLLKSGYKDSSGLILYFTPETRPNDALILVIGQDSLEIPPSKPSVTIDGWCRSECTSLIFTGPVYVAEALNHMHYLGRRQYIEHYRNGTKIRDITREEVFRYDKPFFYQFQDPYEILPGDELKTTCVYNSVGKPLTIFEGFGTRDEMCYGLLLVYPSQNIKQSYCTAWKSIPQCLLSVSKDYDGCNFKNFKNASHPDVVQLRKELFTRCVPFGRCLEECKAYVKKLKSTHPCLKNDIGDQIRRHHMSGDPEMMKFYIALDSCDAEIEKEKCPCDESNGGCGVSAASWIDASSVTIFLGILLQCLLNIFV